MDTAASSLNCQASTSELTPVSLILIETRHKVVLPSVPVVCLGRRDEELNILPHIDLTDDKAALHGVSRRHARIHQREDGVFIEDLDSTNGTFLNSQRLHPSCLYPLDHGDMLQLGFLKLAVAFLQL